MPILIVIAVIVVAAVAIYFGYLAQKKRREEMAALAAQLGWRFDPTKDRSHDDEYSHFEIFRRGHNRCAFNTLTGELTIDERGYPAKMGDFVYKITTSTGKSTQTHTYRFSYLIPSSSPSWTRPLSQPAASRARPEGALRLSPVACVKLKNEIQVTLARV